MTACCDKPDIVNMDYRTPGQLGESFVPVWIENRVCLTCKTYWWAGKQYTRKEWDALMEEEQ